MAKVCLVGGGAVGSALAKEFQSRGHHVDLIAERLPDKSPIIGNEGKRIVTDLAVGIGCIFKPSSFLVADLVLKSYVEWMEQAANTKDDSVSLTNLYTVTNSDQKPEWADRVRDYRVHNSKLASYSTYSFNPAQVVAKRIEMIQERMKSLGGQIQKRPLAANEVAMLRSGESFPKSDMTVLAMGIKARDIYPELKLFPVRGVLAHFPDAESEKNISYMNEDNATYAISSNRGIVLGGTFDEGVGTCSDEEKSEITKKIINQVTSELHEYGISLPSFKLEECKASTVGYRPAVQGDPIIDIGETYEKIVNVTGLGGQGHVSGQALARLVVDGCEQIL